MSGMQRQTGGLAGELDHIRQSIATILATPIGARVMRRDFGSLVPELIDQPLNAPTRLRFFAAVALALLRWEPRVTLRRLALTATSPAEAARGRVNLDLEVQLRRAGRPVLANLTVPLRGPIGLLQPAYDLA